MYAPPQQYGGMGYQLPPAQGGYQGSSVANSGLYSLNRSVVDYSAPGAAGPGGGGGPYFHPPGEQHLGYNFNQGGRRDLYKRHQSNVADRPGKGDISYEIMDRAKEIDLNEKKRRELVHIYIYIYIYQYIYIRNIRRYYKCKTEINKEE